MSTEEHENITAETFDLMAWIQSGTVATRQVTIYNNPALAAEYETLEAEMVAAEKTVEDAAGDAPMSAHDPREDIRARMEDLYARWEASKSTWTVRALSDDDIEATYDAQLGGVPSPKQPVPPLPQAGKKALEDHGEKVTKWAKAVHEADRERTLHLIAKAVTSVETARGSVDGVSVDEVRSLRDRPHGPQWVGLIPSGRGQRITGKLAMAVMAATEADVEVPRPTSPERSTTTQG